MKTTQLLADLQFHDANPNADPIYVDKNGRVILFTLKPKQSIKGHDVPQSPFYAVVLKGHGFFAGSDRKERHVGPDDLVIFEPGEEHFVRADDEELAFVGFLHGEPSNHSDKIGGEIAHSRNLPVR
jgi:quercetin dioxygenase-like cupin family protein